MGSNRDSRVIFSQDIYCGGYSGEDPPLPIPNREVKLAIADGTAPPGGRVGSCHFLLETFRVMRLRRSFFLLAAACPPPPGFVPAPSRGISALRAGRFATLNNRPLAADPLCISVLQKARAAGGEHELCVSRWTAGGCAPG